MTFTVSETVDWVKALQMLRRNGFVRLGKALDVMACEALTEAAPKPWHDLFVGGRFAGFRAMSCASCSCSWVSLASLRSRSARSSARASSSSRSAVSARVVTDASSR